MGVIMSELLLYVDKRDNKKTESVEKLSFLIVGATLLLSVYDSLTRPAPNKSFIDILFLSATSIAGLLNIVFAIMLNKIKIEKRKITFYRIILGISGLILIIDGINKYSQNYHSIQYLLLIAGFLYFAVALFYDDMQKRKFVKINEEGIFHRSSFIKQKFFRWNEINSIQFDDKQLTLSLNNNKPYSFKIFPKENAPLSDFKARLREETSKRDIKLMSQA
jgi:hypothetical protein